MLRFLYDTNKPQPQVTHQSWGNSEKREWREIAKKARKRERDDEVYEHQVIAKILEKWKIVDGEC